MATQMVLDALETARHPRGARLETLIAHADAANHFTSVGYGERLDDIGTASSTGSLRDSDDNALAEAVNALRFPPFRGDMLYKEELCLDHEEYLIGSSVMGLSGSSARPAGRWLRWPWGLGVDEGTLGNWVRRDRAGRAGGLSADERAELVELRKENATSPMVRDVLKGSVVGWVNEATR